MDFSVDFPLDLLRTHLIQGAQVDLESITVLSQSVISNKIHVREITAHDGVKGRLTDKSTNHLTSKHGHVLGIDDPLPPNPESKAGKYHRTDSNTN
jgi:hypothetical protein